MSRILPPPLVVSLLFFFFTPSFLGAQYPDYEFEHITVEHGLSHASVYSVAQDSIGFLWLGTADGLNKYDGVKLTVYRHDPAEPNSLSSSNFGEILVHSSGVMWFGTWGGGLTLYDPSTDTFTRYLHDPADPRSLSEDRIEYLHEDSQGTVWIATERAGLNRFDPRSESFVRYRHDSEDPRSVSSDQVKTIHEDRSGTLWIGTDNGLDRFDRATESFVRHRHDPDDPESLSSNRIRAIVHDTSGALWVGTRGGGLNRFDPETGSSRRYRHDPRDPQSLSDDSVSVLFADSFGILWIGTYKGGLNRFDPETGLFDSYRYDSRSPGSLSHNRVEALHEDRSHNLWIGTRAGADKLDLKRAKFRQYIHDPYVAAGLPHPSVRAIASAGEGDDALWIGTDGGLARFDPRSEHFQLFRHESGRGLSSDRIWSILVDREGTLWAGTYDAGLNRLVRKGETFEVTRYQHDPRDPSSLSSDRVQAIFEDRDGDLWLGTGDGLNRVMPRPAGERLLFEVYRTDPDVKGKLSSNYVIIVFQDRSGRLWAGTRDGLHQFDTTTRSFQRIVHTSRVESSGTNSILSILEDEVRENLFWIGTEGGGLGRLDPATGSFTQYLLRDGLASNFINGILEDDRGNLWLSTSSGLSRFDPESEVFRNFDAGNGMQNHGFHRNASFRSTSGEMFFGGIKGLTSFLPDLVQDNPYTPPIVLTSIKIFNEELELDKPLAEVDEIELSHNNNSISIEFVGLDYTSPSHNNYAYQMEGIDEDWIQAGTRTYAGYANLASGKYVFKVKGANSDGVWNEEGTSLRLIITPPFWRTKWFYALSFMAPFLLVFSVYQIRMNAVRRKNIQLEEINEQLNQQIAERQRAEADKERLITELQESNSEMKRFNYTISHDLKSPLFTIKGFLGLLKKDAAEGDSERMSADIEQIENAADKMGSLLKELLDLSRIGRRQNPLTEIDMTELAREARDLVGGRISERGVEVEIAPDMAVVVGDRVRLLQVYQNLIDNAVKFMDRQAAPRIEIGILSERESGPAFYVRDNGRGIAPRYRERVFKLFERLDADDDGTGVGLAVAKRVIDIHGGRLWVESEGEGCGSTFYFTLPAGGVSETEAWS